MQPEDLANAFATFADKVDMMSEVVDRFNSKLTEFGAPESHVDSTEVETPQVAPEVETPPVPPTTTTTVEETVQDMPNSVLSLVEALNTWKGK